MTSCHLHFSHVFGRRLRGVFVLLTVVQSHALCYGGGEHGKAAKDVVEFFKCV